MPKPDKKGKGKGSGKDKNTTNDKGKGSFSKPDSVASLLKTNVKSAVSAANKYGGPIGLDAVKTRGLASEGPVVVTQFNKGLVNPMTFSQGKPAFTEEIIPDDVVNALTILNGGEAPVSSKTHVFTDGMNSKTKNRLRIKKRVVKSIFSFMNPGAKLTDSEMRNPGNKSLAAVVNNVDSALEDFVPPEIITFIKQSDDVDAASKNYATFGIPALDIIGGIGAIQRDMKKLPIKPYATYLLARLEEEENYLTKVPTGLEGYFKAGGSLRCAKVRGLFKHANHKEFHDFLEGNWPAYYATRMTAEDLENYESDWSGGECLQEQRPDRRGSDDEDDSGHGGDGHVSASGSQGQEQRGYSDKRKGQMSNSNAGVQYNDWDPTLIKGNQGDGA